MGLVTINTDNVENMDFDLACVILPMLENFRKQTISYPYVDPEDVPEHLQPTTERSKDHNDDTHKQRWLWVLDEMIYAFSKKNFEDEIGNNYIPGGTYLLSELDRRANGFRLFGKYYEGLQY
jgi:hypothetical protein